jgi:hypothetical protein
MTGEYGIAHRRDGVKLRSATLFATGLHLDNLRRGRCRGGVPRVTRHDTYG